MNFERARKIADAVMYEGYNLYPYRPSSLKNRFRWQFGIVAPREWSENGGGDPWEMQTECLVEAEDGARLDVAIRFLQVQAREGEPWEDGIERVIEWTELRVLDLAAAPREERFAIGLITGVVKLSAQPIDSFLKVTVRVENHTPFFQAAEGDRSKAMRMSLVGAHTMFAISQGAFVSVTSPPPAALLATQACSNVNTWPVLVGEPGSRNMVLSAPIILEDHPSLAPESAGDFHDGTEIDEILTLRVMTLTDAEKREVCRSDEGARQIIDRCDNMPPEIFERLHGAIRSMGAAPLRPQLHDVEGTEEFFNPKDENPEQNSAVVDGSTVTRGERVRIAPKRSADAMDLFLAGRTAVVAAIHHDLDDRIYVAVTVEDDPAADLQGRVGRYFYFDPDELELVGKEK